MHVIYCKEVHSRGQGAEVTRLPITAELPEWLLTSDVTSSQAWHRTTTSSTSGGLHPIGKSIHLKDYDPGWAGDPNLPKAERETIRRERALTGRLEVWPKPRIKLYAANRWSILIILQAMDAAGKDGTIKHVMSGVNPQGCQVFSFKQPSAEELDHNFLWRYAGALPSAAGSASSTALTSRKYSWSGSIPSLSKRRALFPTRKIDDDFWADRFADINAFERHLTRNGTVILKFFLHISKDEQRKRLIKRLKDPKKHWKFSAADLAERAFWNDYMKAYEEAISATSTKWAPWHIIPADHKWVSRALVSRFVTTTIESLDLQYPEVTEAQLGIIAEAKKQLEVEKES